MKEAHRKLQELEGKSGDAWKSLSQGITKAWIDMREATRQAAEKFK